MTVDETPLLSREIESNGDRNNEQEGSMAMKRILRIGVAILVFGTLVSMYSFSQLRMDNDPHFHQTFLSDQIPSFDSLHQTLSDKTIANGKLRVQIKSNLITNEEKPEHGCPVSRSSLDSVAQWLVAQTHMKSSLHGESPTSLTWTTPASSSSSFTDKCTRTFQHDTWTLQYHHAHSGSHFNQNKNYLVIRECNKLADDSHAAAAAAAALVQLDILLFKNANNYLKQKRHNHQLCSGEEHIYSIENNHSRHHSVLDLTATFCAHHGMDNMVMFMDGFRSSLQNMENSCLSFLFPTWNLDDRGSFLGAMVVAFLLAIILEGISTLRPLVLQHMSKGPVRKIVIILLYILQQFMGYVVMFVSMMYSIELMCSIILGFMVGNLLFGQGDSHPVIDRRSSIRTRL